MRVLAWSSLVLLAFAIVGWLLPDEIATQRSLSISARPEAIHPELDRLATWPEWSIWNAETDPGARFAFSGPERGAGAVWTWEGGKKFKQGRLELVESDPERGIRYRVNVEGFEVDGRIDFEPAGDGTKLVWIDRTEIGRGPLGGWIRLAIHGMVDREVGGNMEKSLAGLKRRVEGSGGGAA
jgi:hypothetical protein